MKKKQLALFASGTGSNAVNFIHYFAQSELAEIALVLSNKADAPVLEKAAALGVPTVIISNAQAANGVYMVELMQKYGIDFIVLAGYLRFIPSELIAAFKGKMVNIHPSLLPKYGGPGMYGSKVHQAVVANKEKESGITIHYVNEEYDKGTIIYQKKTTVGAGESAATLAEKIHHLEHEHYPKVVEGLLTNI